MGLWFSNHVLICVKKKSCANYVISDKQIYVSLLAFQPFTCYLISNAICIRVVAFCDSSVIFL
ncbi:hypothetical protein MtrunA17_Chr8g0340121 [Medicago truncatula]|uniref:Uncharacterized protein n=1 Tax=Medicago truncatula TaxID=3880 RepID=I3SWW7_MEDTR|nr:unknown [Medicago truncatula]RHN39090.1 hypothetical protein MtrunA17_Chr8g0340121 [Medicago truncatula]